jgi:hypothetical protein
VRHSRDPQPTISISFTHLAAAGNEVSGKQVMKLLLKQRNGLIYILNVGNQSVAAGSV